MHKAKDRMAVKVKKKFSDHKKSSHSFHVNLTLARQRILTLF